MIQPQANDLSSISTALNSSYMTLIGDVVSGPMSKIDGIAPSASKPEEKLRHIFQRITAILERCKLSSLDDNEKLESEKISLTEIKVKIENRNNEYLRKISNIWTLRGIRRFFTYPINIIARYFYNSLPARIREFTKPLFDTFFPAYREISKEHKVAYQSLSVKINQKILDVEQTIGILVSKQEQLLKQFGEQKNQIQKQERLEKENLLKQKKEAEEAKRLQAVKNQRQKAADELKKSCRALSIIWNESRTSYLHEMKAAWLGVLNASQEVVGLESIDRLSLIISEMPNFPKDLIPLEQEKRKSLIKSLNTNIGKPVDFVDESIKGRLEQFIDRNPEREIVKTLNIQTKQIQPILRKLGVLAKEENRVYKSNLQILM